MATGQYGTNHPSYGTDTTVTTSAGSATVTGVGGTTWLTTVTAGDLLNLEGDPIVYQVQSVASNTSLTLTSAFPTTQTTADYIITRDFTSIFEFIIFNAGDQEAWTLLNRNFRLIENNLNFGLDWQGRIESDQYKDSSNLPTGDPLDGYKYIMSDTPTVSSANEWDDLGAAADDICVYDADAATGEEWSLTAAAARMLAYIADDGGTGGLYIYDGTAWQNLTLTNITSLPSLTVNVDQLATGDVLCYGVSGVNFSVDASADRCDIYGKLGLYGDADTYMEYDPAGGGANLAARYHIGGFRFFAYGLTPGVPEFRVNPQQADIDFYVESDTYSYALRMDASTGNVSVNYANSSYQFTIGSTDHSDRFGFYHDNTDAYITTDDGSFIFLTDEGTDTNTYVDILGKGTGYGIFRLADQGDDSYLQLYCATSRGRMETAGVSPAQIDLQRGAHADITMFENAASGETPTLDIYGYKAGDAKRTLSIGISSAIDDAVSFSGLTKYIWDMGMMFADYAATPAAVASYAQLWGEDIAGTEELRCRDSAGGAAVTLSPHSGLDGPITVDPNDPAPFSYHEISDVIGLETWIYTSKLLRTLDADLLARGKMTESCIYERQLGPDEMRDWDEWAAAEIVRMKAADELEAQKAELEADPDPWLPVTAQEANEMVDHEDSQEVAVTNTADALEEVDEMEAVTETRVRHRLNPETGEIESREVEVSRQQPTGRRIKRLRRLHRLDEETGKIWRTRRRTVQRPKLKDRHKLEGGQYYRHTRPADYTVSVPTPTITKPKYIADRLPK